MSTVRPDGSCEVEEGRAWFFGACVWKQLGDERTCQVSRHHQSDSTCQRVERVRPRILAAGVPELCISPGALEEGGRREHRVFVAPAASRTKVESTRVSHHRYAEAVRRSLHDGLRLIPRSPRSAGLDSLRRLPMIIIDKLDPSVGGSGPRGFARPRRHRTPGDIRTSIASRSNVCGDWPNAPPCGSGTGGSKH